MTDRHINSSRPHGRRHRRLALALSLVALSMLGVAFAAVPLYRIFCQVTGYGGTTQKAENASGEVLERTINIRFDANVAHGLGWDFGPVERRKTVRIGETVLISYRAHNRDDEPLSGTATFNVTPEIAGRYFNKIECFCFTKQTLAAGETKDMPVQFFVDPDITRDADAKDVAQITLSYTFFPDRETRAGVASNKTLGKAKGEGGGGGS